jgi:hypothetical protein
MTEKEGSLRDRIKRFKERRAQGHQCFDAEELCSDLIQAFEGLALDHLLLRIETGDIVLGEKGAVLPGEDDRPSMKFGVIQEADDYFLVVCVESDVKYDFDAMVSRDDALFMVSTQQFAWVDDKPMPASSAAGYPLADASWHPFHRPVEDGDIPPPLDQLEAEGMSL